MDITPIFISLKTSVCSVAITFVVGVIAAWLVNCIRSKKIKAITDAILTIPLVLPPTVAGFFLLYLFGINGVIGKILVWLGVKIVFSWQATVIASFAMSFPLMYRSALGAFEQLPPNIINAARTLGMSEWKIFLKVMLPNAMPGIVSGGILSFARGLGEFGATAMLAGNIAGVTRTLPLAVYSAMAGGDTKTAAFYVCVIVAAAIFMVSCMNLITLRRK